MAGPNLEVFKFGIYVFFPVAMMLHYGNPQWYANHVLPYRNAMWPPEEKTFRPPTEMSEIQAELARLKNARLQRRAAAESLLASSNPSSTS